ncbi:MAG: ADP-ribosylglycohydrolase [Candidatus Pelagibacter sp.]|nr:ADP-ribosylglycohydrolase [Candidatus Pelagibacter sp.]OUW24567.1 MAG: ADP-ribosylglycohydrolase [Rickettsiales bacterium TMED174]|tara:strand:+ start:472 stop:1419 length:948 start_codon:yes stop_codon:yes gene_type:complete
MRNNLHVFLGSTVADAGARPLHWVYNQKKLLTYIKGRKDFTFLKKNKSPFYDIKTGKVSGYNDIGQVMFKTLIEGHENIEKRFKKNILKNFGPGSNYWKNYNLRAKYRKVKDWRGIIKGPWIHQNIIETIQNIKRDKKLTGGKKVNESDGFCAALPYFLYGYNFANLKKIISIVTISKISIKYALAKLYIIDLALKGSKNPIRDFNLKYKNNLYFNKIIKGINKVKKLSREPHPLVVKKLGMACSYPGTFESSIHSILNSANYKSAILKTVKAGGCSCSRANFIGAYFAALNGLKSIPKRWIKKTSVSKKILNQM